MDIARHEIDYDAADTAYGQREMSMAEAVDAAAQKPRKLAALMNKRIEAAALASVTMPGCIETPEHLQCAAETSAEFFDAARRGAVHESLVDLNLWVTGYFLGRLCRHQDSLNSLCQTTSDMLRASSTKHPEYRYLLVDALRALHAGSNETASLLVRALEATDTNRPDIHNPEWVLNIDGPLLWLLYYTLENADEFQTALLHALQHHKKFWTQAKDRRAAPNGFLPIAINGVCAIAHDHGIAVSAESDYLLLEMITQQKEDIPEAIDLDDDDTQEEFEEEPEPTAIKCVTRHEIDFDLAKQRYEANAEDLDTFVEAAARHPGNNHLLIGQAMSLAKRASVVQCDAGVMREYVSIAARACANLFEGARTVGVNESIVEPRKWITGYFAAHIVRSDDIIDSLCETSGDMLRESSTKHPEYRYLFVDALRAFHVRSRDTMGILLQAVQATDPERPDIRKPDWVLDIDVPIMKTLFYTFDDFEKFEDTLVDALESHKGYWSQTAARRRDPDGFLPVALNGICAIAHDFNIPFEVESEYLPAELVSGTG